MRFIGTTLTASRLLTERTVINDSPEYQRESAIWSKSKQQLFIDTILNDYDVPKLYFHDLREDNQSHYNFAIVDGKQRVHAIWDFLEDKLELGSDVKMTPEAKKLNAEKALEGQKKSELHQHWQDRIRDYVLPVVVIQNAI